MAGLQLHALVGFLLPGGKQRSNNSGGRLGAHLLGHGPLAAASADNVNGMLLAVAQHCAVLPYAGLHGRAGMGRSRCWQVGSKAVGMGGGGGGGGGGRRAAA